MSRHPLAPKITDTLHEMYKDAKKVNDPQDANELVRKLAVIRSMNEKIQKQLEIAQKSSRPDVFMQRKLQAALEENQTIESSVQRSLELIQGAAGDTLQLRAELQERAAELASLRALYDQSRRQSEVQAAELQARLQALEQVTTQLEENIRQKDAQIQTLEDIQRRTQSQGLEARIQALQQEKLDLQAQFNQDRLQHAAELQQKQQELAALRQNLDTRAQEIEQCSAQVDQLNVQNQQAEQRLAASRQQLQELRAQTEARVAQVQQQLQQMGIQVQKVNLEKQQLSADIQQLEQQVQQVEEEKAQVVAQLQELEQKTNVLPELRQELQQAQGQLQQAQGQLQQTQAQLQQAQVQLQQTQESANLAEEKQAEAQVSGNKQLQKEKDDLLQQVQQAQQQVAQARQLVAQKDQDVDLKRAEIERLKEQLNKSQEITNLLQQNAALESNKANRLDTQLQQAQQQVKQIKEQAQEEIKEIRDELARKTAELKAEEELKKEAMASAKRVQDKIDRRESLRQQKGDAVLIEAKRQLEESIQERDKTSDELQKLKSQNAILEQVHQALEQEHQKLVQDLDALREQKQQLEEKQKEALSQQLREKEAESEAKIVQSEAKVVRSEAKVAELRDKVAELEAKVVDSGNKLAEAEAQVGQVEQKVSEAERKLREAEAEIAAIQQKADARIAAIQAQVQAQIQEYQRTEIAPIQQALATKQQEVAQKEAESRVLLEQIKQLTSQKAEVEQKLQQKEDDVKQQSGESQKSSAELQAVTRKRDALQKSLEQSKAKEKALEANVEELRQQLANKDQEIKEKAAELQKSQREFQQNLEEKEQQMKQQVSRLDELERELKESQQSNLEKGQSNEQLQQRITNLIKEKQKEVADATQKAEMRVQQFEQVAFQQLEKAQQELKGEKSAAVEALKKGYEDQLTALRAELEVKKTQHEQLQKAKEDQTGDLETQITTLRQTLEEEQAKLIQEKDDCAAQKRRIADEYEAEKTRLQQEKENLEAELARVRQELETQRAEWESARQMLEKKFTKSAEEKAQVEQKVQEFIDKGGYPTPEELYEEMEKRKKIQEQNETLLKTLKGQVTKMTDAQREQLEAHRKALEELKNKWESDMKEKETASLAEKNRLQNDIDTLKLEKTGLDEKITTLNTKQQELEQSLGEKETRIQTLENDVKEIEQKTREELTKVWEKLVEDGWPSAFGKLKDVLLENWHTIVIIEIQKEKLDVLEKGLDNILEAYKTSYEEKMAEESKEEMGGEIKVRDIVDITVDRPVFDRQQYGVRDPSMRRYLLSCLYMFHSFKTLMRIATMLRDPTQAVGEENAYLYDVPSGDSADDALSASRALRTLIGAKNIWDTYSAKIVEKKMRIDILLYFIIIGLTKNIDKNPGDDQYRPLIGYIQDLIRHANEKLASLSTKLASTQKEKAASLRRYHNKQNAILTYVRLSCATTKPNDRFKYQIVDDKIFDVKYSDTPKAYYQKVGNDFILTDPNDPIVHNSHYHFGPFTHIFEYTESNDAIANSTTFRNELELQLRNNKPVCIIGYGASGSGKTTTLVYADYMTPAGRVTEPGLLVLLSNNLGAPYRKGSTTYKGYDTCNVTIYELEADPSIKKESDVKGICRKYPGRRKSIYRVTCDADGKNCEQNNVPYDDCDEKNDLSFEYQFTDGEWRNNAGKGLHEELVEYINVKRNIAPSPNNPKSSRSHIICILEFSRSRNPDESVSLIVCDFAGVENKFNCQDPQSLDKMGTQLLVDLEKQKILANFNQIQVPAGTSTEALIWEQINTQLRDPFEYISVPPSKYLQLMTMEMLEKYVKTAAKCIDIFYEKGSLKDMPIKELYKSWTGKVGKALDDLKFDITKIKDFESVNKTSSENALFKEGIPYKVPWAGIMNDLDTPDIQELIDLYTTFVNPKDKITIPTITYIIKVIVWFMYSYTSTSSPVKFQIANILRQSALSKEVGAEQILPQPLIEKDLKSYVCQTRVNEGIFINKSLADLRRFIADVMQKRKQGDSVAPFIDKCAPLQCNPYYRDCFGQNLYYEPPSKDQLGGDYGLLSQYINNVPNSQNMVFCIMNVVNLSKWANNPPPSPYIDITDLQIEYERLLPTLTYDQDGLGMSTRSGILSELPPSLIKATTRLLTNPLLQGVSQDFIKTLMDTSRFMLQGQVDTVEYLGKIIQLVNNFNAITAIGTLEFTDMMAKYAKNRVTCNTMPQIPAVLQQQSSAVSIQIPASVPSTPRGAAASFQRGRSREPGIAATAAVAGQQPPASPTADIAAVGDQSRQASGKTTRKSADQLAMEEAAKLLSKDRLPRGVVKRKEK